ncbi:MAG: class I SAM-dependent methyltransferase [bacterium]
MNATTCLPQNGETISNLGPDFEAIKTKQRATWGDGDYNVIGRSLQLVGETLCEAADVRGDERVLDVAAGTGNAALAAARRWAQVTAADYVESLLDRTRVRAEADGMALETRVADAEALPFENGSYDKVLSTFGIMFAPNQEKVAAELLRVCRSGGHVALANWTPDGFIGELFKVVGRHVPPPAGVKSAALWGTEARLHELFPAEAAAIRVEKKDFVFRYRSPQHFVDVFRTYYGPVLRAFAALPEERREELERDMLALIDRCNVATDGTCVIPGAYLEVVVTKQ